MVLVLVCYHVCTWTNHFKFLSMFPLFLFLKIYLFIYMGLVGVNISKESACQCKRCKSRGFSPWVGKIPWSRKWQPTPVFLPRESHTQRSLAGYSPLNHKELDTTEYTHTFIFWLLWVCCCVQAFSSCGVQASHCGDFSLQSTDSRVHRLQ